MNRLGLIVLCGILCNCMTACTFAVTYTNSTVFRPVESQKTFAITLDKDQTEAADKKIASLLEHQMELLGYSKSSPEVADLHVAFTQSVQLVAQTGSYAQGTGSSVTIYRKALKVKMLDRSESVRASKPVLLWEAETEEQGWCNRILATVPHIITAMFSNYGATVTHQQKRFMKDDEKARRVMELAPYDLQC